jgi:phosphoribosylanthranilate isomerase
MSGREPANAGAPSRPLVKICGLTRAEDAIAALEAGADAIGVVLAEGSKRRMGAGEARELLADVRRRAGRPFLSVGVLGTLDPVAAREALEMLRFDRVQLHASSDAPTLGLTLDALGPLAERAWGVAHVPPAGPAPAGYETLACEAVLLDTAVPGAGGGSGTSFDWAHAVPLARARRVVLAGGLTPETVAAAVRAVDPWMVDVSSGVESATGIKDAARVRAFVAAVRHVHA